MIKVKGAVVKKVNANLIIVNALLKGDLVEINVNAKNAKMEKNKINKIALIKRKRFKVV